MSDQPRLYHWVDQVMSNLFEWANKHKIKELHVDDMKTPSGRVHTGALRGVLIHDIVYKALLKSGVKQPVSSTYVFNDMDPMDGLPSYLDKADYEPHMGKPLFQIPAPALAKSGVNFSRASEAEKKEFAALDSLGAFYALDFIKAYEKLGATPKIVWSHELYQSGQMDDVIRQVLDNVDKLKKIYKEVADYKLPDKWYPFQVICPDCGKVGTTLVTNWDGEQVTFECQPNKVEWAVGCGYKGKISPFGGTGKLLWKVDWPSHWQVLGVTVEGAGKDHTSAGGSRDMANAIVEKVFNTVPPFDIPYEWILIRGAKMSSSKGIGTSAREFVELFPTNVGRFLFVNRHYNQVIDFDPQTLTIPDLFDEYDAAAKSFWTKEKGQEKLARSFELANDGNIPEPHFLPRFRDVTVWMQYPELDLLQKFEELKGSALTEFEKEVLNERQHYAKVWIDRYAPQEFSFQPKKELPKSANKLSDEQKAFLRAAVEFVESQDWKGRELELQTQLFEIAKKHGNPRQAFAAVYQAFLGKTSGPRAAWFLLSIDPKLRQSRIDELSTKSTQSTGGTLPEFTDTSIFSMSPEFKAKYPSASIGIAIIKGVKLKKSDLALEQEKVALLAELEGLTTDDLSKSPELLSYRKMYKMMGIDWHSRRPSPEALLRRIAQGKGLYSINTCVDAYNLIVMKHRVSVGAFDLDDVQFPTTIKISEGGDQILLLGDKEPTTLKPGEVSYFDQQGPYNLDYNYRDAQRTMVKDDTTNLLINVDGIFDATPEKVEQSLRETVEIIQKYCGGTVEVMGMVK